MVFVLLWSGGFPVAKISGRIRAAADPVGVALRMFVCLLIPLFIITRPALPKSRADWTHACVVGFLVQVIYFGMSYLAFKAGASAGVVAVIVSLQPVLVAAWRHGSWVSAWVRGNGSGWGSGCRVQRE